MKALASILLCLAVCLPGGCKKKPSDGSGSPTGDGPPGQTDPAAWATVQEFRKAWLKRDYKAAKVLFSPELIDRYKRNEDVLRLRVEGLRNHEHQSMDIAGGRPAGERRVEYTLHLRILLRGEFETRVQEDTWNIVLVRYNTQWLIDQIPVPQSGLP